MSEAMTPSELQAENERLKAERDYCQRYYHDVVVEAKRLKAERDEALRSVQVLMESSAENLRLAVTRERERDEARAQAARLAEALRRTRRELPCKAIDEVVDEALSSTDARQWLREQRAEELQALKTTDLRGTVEVYAKNGCPYDEDVIYVSAIDARIAELRREEG